MGDYVEDICVVCEQRTNYRTVESSRRDVVSVCLGCRVRPKHLMLVVSRRPPSADRDRVYEKALALEEQLTELGVRVADCVCAFRY